MSAPLDRKGQVVARLNDLWRITYDPAQWILERRQKRKTKKSSGYQQRSFCAQRRTLMRCIRDYCGDVDPGALAVIEALPEVHPRIERLRRECRS